MSTSAIQRNMSEEVIALESDEVAVLIPSAAGAINKSEVEAQLDAAHKYPRSVKRFLAEAVTLATFNEEIAASCIYSMPRDGKNIAGPSVRLAEICASAWGNLHAGARVIGVEDTVIVGQGVAWDLEKNVRITSETRRRITDRNGKRYKDDMVQMTGNAAASISLRNAIFRVIPKAYVNHVYEAARAVAVGNASTLSDKRATVIERLIKMGALKERILLRIGRPSVEDINLDDLEILIGIGTAIKSGELKVDEAFPAVSGNAPEKSTVNLDDIKPAADENRGHGQENLAKVKKSPETAKPDQKRSDVDPQWRASVLLQAFTAALKPKHRPRAEELLNAFLKGQNIVDGLGFGTPLAIRDESYEDVKTAALDYAAGL